MFAVNEIASSFDGSDYTRVSRQVGLRDMRNCKVVGRVFAGSEKLWR